MPRQKNTSFLPYADARSYIQSRKDKPSSRSQYYKWRKYHHNLDFMPRQPHRAYAGEWVSWNDFLGTKGSFEATVNHNRHNKIVYRTYWEAVKYAQQKAREHNITTQREWREWHESGMCARDIPKHPQSIYPEFTRSGWGVWLGKKPQHVAVAAKEVKGVWCIAQTLGRPVNWVTLIVDKSGINHLRENWQSELWGKPYRIYTLEQELVSYVEKILHRHTFPKEGNQYLVPNMNALLFDLDTILEFAIPPQQMQRYFQGGMKV